MAITASSLTTALENNATVSSETISKGDTVTINTKADGGAGSYTYAVYYCYVKSKTCISCHSERSEESFLLCCFSGKDPSLTLRMTLKN